MKPANGAGLIVKSFALLVMAVLALGAFIWRNVQQAGQAGLEYGIDSHLQPTPTDPADEIRAGLFNHQGQVQLSSTGVLLYASEEDSKKLDAYYDGNAWVLVLDPGDLRLDRVYSGCFGSCISSDDPAVRRLQEEMSNGQLVQVNTAAVPWPRLE